MALEGFGPDLTLVLDLPVEAGIARAAARSSADRYERMGAAFHRRVRDGFLAIAAAEPQRCAVIDAGAGAEAVFAELARTVRERLGATL